MKFLKRLEAGSGLEGGSGRWLYHGHGSEL